MDMYGWDAVSLVSIVLMNEAIAERNSSPTELNMSTNEMSTQGTFAAWQLNGTGGPDTVGFNIPISAVSGNTSDSSGKVTYTFEYEVVIAKVELTLTLADAETASRNLIVDSKNPPTDLVSVTDVNGNKLTDIIASAVIQKMLLSWLDQNLDQFGHVFASINLAPSPSTGQWAFCQANVMAYSFLAGSTLENSYLGLLYNTGDNSQPGSVNQIDPTFIPAGSRVAFVISPTLFINQFVVPSICEQFSVSQLALTVDTDNNRITLASGQTGHLGEVTDPLGRQHDADVNNLVVSVEDSLVSIYADTSAVIWDELGTVTSYNASRSWVKPGLSDGGSGSSGKTLTWTDAQPSVNNHSTSESLGIEIAQKVLGELTVLVGVIAGILTDGLGAIVAGAFVGLAQGGFQYALAWLEENGQDAAPDVDGLVMQMSLPVDWAASESGRRFFVATEVGLHGGAFFLSGYGLYWE